jgi:uncharacterized surface protein with fasciclin (FAS1) repeats
LNYHILLGILTSSILVEGFVSTVEGGLVEVSVLPSLKFNQVPIVFFDILANNGVLHKINQVLDPNDGSV